MLDFLRIENLSTLNLGTRHLIVVALIALVTASIAVNAASAFRLSPQMFLERGELQEDAFRNFNKIEEISSGIGKGDLLPLVDHEISIFTRAYAVSHFIFSPITGNNTLSFLPLNILFYVCLLFGLFFVGKRLVDEKLAFWGVVGFGLLPSVLLHFTQPLRDPMFVAVFAIFVAGLFNLFEGELGPTKRVTSVFIVLGSLCFLYFVRDRWNLLFVMVLSAALGITILRSVLARKTDGQVLISMAIVLVFAIFMPTVFHGLESDKGKMDSASENEIARREAELASEGVPGYLRRLNKLRWAFEISYGDAGSALKEREDIRSAPDLVLAIPGAALNGFFAPFPTTWFIQGKQYGRAGRLIAGAEMVLAYIAMILGAIGLLKRFSFRAMFLAATVSFSLVALGFVISNAGALHRMRLGFWALLAILAVNGVAVLFSREGDPTGGAEVNGEID